MSKKLKVIHAKTIKERIIAMISALEKILEHIVTPIALCSVALDYIIIGFTIFFVIQILYEEKHKKHNEE